MKYKIKELCKIKHGYAFKGQDILKTETEYILVTPGNFAIGGGFKCDKCKYFSNNGFIPKEYILKSNDLVITMTDLSVDSDTLGYSALIPNDGKIYLHNQRIGLIFDINETLVLKNYLYWHMRTYKYQKAVVASQSGTAIHHTAPERILALEIDLPSLETQKKVVKILEDIDKKIELNNQINESLFKILKQYLKENYYNNCNIEVKTLKNVGRIQGGYAFKSKDLLDESTQNKIFKIKNITSNGIDIENTQCIYDEIANKIDKKFLLTQGNVIIAMTGAELGKTGYIYGNEYRYFLNQRVGVIRGNDIFSELYLNCIFLQDDMQNLLNSKGYGSAQPNISTTDIENIEIPIPNRNELEDFYEVCNPMYNKLILNSEQNQYLMKLRDTLLPKLMNGEIDLSNIKI